MIEQRTENPTDKWTNHGRQCYEILDNEQFKCVLEYLFFPYQLLHVFHEKLAVTADFKDFPTLKDDVFFYFSIFIRDKVNWHGVKVSMYKEGDTLANWWSKRILLLLIQEILSVARTTHL